MNKRLIIPIYINHSGCPRRCVFCNQDGIAGMQRGIPESRDISKTITDYLDSWRGRGQKEIAFYGGSFTAIDKAVQERLLLDVQPFIYSGQIDAVRISTRPDFIDDDTLAFLEKYGVKTIELGIQSMDDDVLSASNRGHHVTDNVRACHLVKSKGFSLGCQLMPGLPFDSDEKSMGGAFRISEIRPDFVRIYPALVIKGTELERLYHSNDYRPLSLLEAIERCSSMVALFRRNGIDVIRVGLQPTKALDESIVAGPYHPAFGELVESHLFFEKAMDQINRSPSTDGKIIFGLSPKDESAFRGQRNANMKKLKEMFPQQSFHLTKMEGLLKGSLIVQ